MIKSQVSKYCAFFLGALIASSGVQANPVLSLKTSLEDVNGVRDIEAGHYQKGIRKLQTALARTTVSSNRRPLLTNLCVAHVALGDLVRAGEYCHLAVQPGNTAAHTIALNNRAVWHYLQNDHQAAMTDFEAANDTARMPALIHANMTSLAGATSLAKN